MIRQNSVSDKSIKKQGIKFDSFGETNTLEQNTPICTEIGSHLSLFFYSPLLHLFSIFPIIVLADASLFRQIS